jgi:hypothetical protein
MYIKIVNTISWWDLDRKKLAEECLDEVANEGVKVRSW